MKYVRMIAMLLIWGAVSALPASIAKAGIINIDLTGFESYGGFGLAANTSVVVNIGAGSSVTNISYSNLNITAEGASFLSELAISVNDSAAANFWDDNPFVGQDAPGTSATVAGSFVNPGLFGSGPFTVLPDGDLLITVYDLFNDGGAATRDTLVNSGTLTIEFVTAVPEPSTYAMMGLAMTVGGGIAARRKMKKAKA